MTGSKLLDPVSFQLDQRFLSSGLYESFYFRGINKERNRAFWLKHNFLLYRNNQFVIIDGTLILFSRDNPSVKVYKVRDQISLEQFFEEKIPLWKNWNGFTHQFQNGSAMTIAQNFLKGTICDHNEKITWDLQLSNDHETYFHFGNKKFYFIGFPKKKILTNNIRLNFQGKIGSDFMTGAMIGINGHNWGKEHAHKYVYASCNVFNGTNVTAYFDAFTAKINLAGGLRSPYLSSASLKVADQWYYFNQVLTSWVHKVTICEEKRWEAKFKNDSYILEISLDAKDEPWVYLEYEHPSKKVSIVGSTKFGNGTLTLKNRKTGEIVISLASDAFEFESLMPRTEKKQCNNIAQNKERKNE